VTTLESASFVRGGGITGALIRSIDWRDTPLGPASQWPQSLRTAINICVSSRFPIALYWGSEYVMLYNDDLIPMVGANKHPSAMGRPAFEVLPEIRTIIEPMLDKVMTTGDAIWSEDLMLPLFRNDAQSESYFTFTYSPIYNEVGEVAGVFCAVLETTAKIIEERRLRLLNALAQITSAKRPADACEQAAEQLARAPNDVPFALLYLADAGSRFTLAGAANLEPGTESAPESIVTGDGSIWPLDASTTHAPIHVELPSGPNAARGAVISPIERAAGGPPLGFLVVGLSALLRSTESYDRFHRLLASSISQGVSNAAAYEAERQRAEELAKLDRAKTMFFSNVSHEFRTPLTLMLAPIQDMLAAPPGTAIDQASVQLLQRNAVRLLKLVNTLLEFSRLEAGRLEVVFEPVDLSALTIDLATNFRGAIERAGLSLVLDCPALPEPVYVDRGMWEKIVLNLLSNALKFTFEGTITVRMRSEPDVACLEVQDTGTGIRDGDLGRVFERFHRIEGARSRSYEGSGIGLALIQELVKLHGGEISVASRVDEGSTFRVRIPKGKAHLDPERIRASRSLAPTTGGSDAFVHEALRWGAQESDVSAVALENSTTGSDARILFVDDNADMREYVARLLSERWHVELASDGDEALAAIRRNHPDLVLCDAMMPGLDGLSLLRAIRADEALRTLPVIMLSARAGEEEAARGLTAGANDYISKPFSARDLLVRVATNLAASKSARENVLARQTAEAAERTQRLLLEFQERFVAVLGHDLRNPIYAINMAAGLLTQLAPKFNDELTTRTIRRLGSSSRRMAKMVDQLMDLSRLRLGTGFTLAPIENDLCELLTEVIEELRTAHSTRTIVLECPPGVVGSWDRDRLEQVFSNLIGNAVHHGLPDTAITVSVQPERDVVCVEVHNRGAPIPEEIRDTLFEPFRRGERISRTNSAGLGLGLYISRELVHAHGGAIAVSSDSVHGTVFRVTLPRVAGESRTVHTHD
jgi:signal transduction histidine kinase